MAQVIACGGPDPVVADLELQLVGPVADGDLGDTRARVLERVGQALLDDSIRGEVDRPRQREGLAVDVEPDRQAGAPDLFHQRIETVEAGLRRELGLFTVVAHGPEQTAHLGKS